jgi:hypothetical protein
MFGLKCSTYPEWPTFVALRNAMLAAAAEQPILGSRHSRLPAPLPNQFEALVLTRD